MWSRANENGQLSVHVLTGSRVQDGRRKLWQSAFDNHSERRGSGSHAAASQPDWTGAGEGELKTRQDLTYY